MPTTVPSSVVAEPWTRLGETRTPPLAMVLIAAAICTALTDSDWPKAIRSLRSGWSRRLSSGRMPWLSPRTPMSVRWPSPNAVEVAAQLAAAELVGGAHRADVGGLREHAGQGQPERPWSNQSPIDAAVAAQLGRHRRSGCAA